MGLKSYGSTLKKESLKLKSDQNGIEIGWRLIPASLVPLKSDQNGIEMRQLRRTQWS